MTAFFDPPPEIFSEVQPGDPLQPFYAVESRKFPTEPVLFVGPIDITPYVKDLSIEVLTEVADTTHNAFIKGLVEWKVTVTGLWDSFDRTIQAMKVAGQAFASLAKDNPALYKSLKGGYRYTRRMARKLPRHRRTRRW